LFKAFKALKANTTLYNKYVTINLHRDFVNMGATENMQTTDNMYMSDVLYKQVHE